MNEIPYERVKIARDNGRPTGTDYIKNIFKNFIEFHGDRCYADDKAIVGGIARLNGMPVTVIAIEKGHTAKEIWRSASRGLQKSSPPYEAGGKIRQTHSMLYRYLGCILWS